MGLGIDEMGQSMLTNIRSMQTISLVMVVGLIMVMSKIMEESGHMIRLVKSFARLSKDGRIVGAVMSASIGLLPMPGGAVFSAPMVGASLSNQNTTNEQKAALNYWFRHIWEYWWPLYPGVILAVTMLNVETWRYMVVAAPLTVFSIIAGMVFIFRSIGRVKEKTPKTVAWSSIRQFLWEMLPILIVVLIIICLAGLTEILKFLDYNIKIPSLFSILFGLFVALIWVGIVNHIPLGRFWSAVKRKDILVLLLLILAILIFRGIMEETHAVEYIRKELTAYRIPVVFIIAIMPFISGFITGISIGFVGASFPLIIPMFQTPDMWDYVSYGALAYTFGYMGMMLSPVHVCLLMTKDYFKANLLSSYPYIFKPALFVMIMAVCLFSLIIVL